MTNGDTQLAPGNMRRVGIIIGSPLHSNVWLSFIGAAAVGQGICLHPGNAPWVLMGHHIGSALTDEIRAISDGVPEIIGVLDILD